jgi:hypothetical protein
MSYSTSDEIDRFINSDGKVALKFIIHQIKKLICDPSGRKSYIRNLDNVMRDIFGVGDFASALYSCRSDREGVYIIEKIGTKMVFEIMSDQEIFPALRQLVQMDNDLYNLNSQIKKAEKKGKNIQKSVRKQFEYLLDLYKDGTKSIKKMLHLDDFKKSYKKMYSAVARVAHKDKYYDDYSNSSYSIFDSDFDDEDDDDDDFSYNYGAKSKKYDNLFDEYMSEQKSSRKNSSSRNMRREDKLRDVMSRSRFDSLYSSDDEDDSHDEDSAKIDQLTDQMSQLTSAVQNMQLFSTPAKSAIATAAPAAQISVDEKFDRILNSIDSISQHQAQTDYAVTDMKKWAVSVSELIKDITDSMNEGEDEAEASDSEDDFDNDTDVSDTELGNRMAMNHRSVNSIPEDVRERGELIDRYNTMSSHSDQPQIESASEALNKALSGQPFTPLPKRVPLPQRAPEPEYHIPEPEIRPSAVEVTEQKSDIPDETNQESSEEVTKTIEAANPGLE